MVSQKNVKRNFYTPEMRKKIYDEITSLTGENFTPNSLVDVDALEEYKRITGNETTIKGLYAFMNNIRTSGIPGLKAPTIVSPKNMSPEDRNDLNNFKKLKEASYVGMVFGVSGMQLFKTKEEAMNWYDAEKKVLLGREILLFEQKKVSIQHKIEVNIE